MGGCIIVGQGNLDCFNGVTFRYAIEIIRRLMLERVAENIVDEIFRSHDLEGGEYLSLESADAGEFAHFRVAVLEASKAETDPALAGVWESIMVCLRKDSRFCQ